MHDMIIKFLKETGESLYVGDAYEWRLQKRGTEGLSEFTGDLSVTQDYSRDGGVTDNIRLSDVTRVLKICNVNWRNNRVNRERIQKFFTYKAKYKIYITFEGVTRWIEGVLYRMAMNEPTNEDYLLKITASFHFDNPYYYSIDNFGKDIAELTPYFAFPWISQMGIGTASGVFNYTRSVVLQNDGDLIAYPRIDISFRDTVVNPVVSINNGYIRFIGTFSASDNINIDYTVNPPKIANNGVNIMGICDRASKFDDMYILIGENTISFDADNGSDEMSVSVYYNRVYMVI